VAFYEAVFLEDNEQMDFQNEVPEMTIAKRKSRLTTEEK
jgi:hypothetical protein